MRTSILSLTVCCFLCSYGIAQDINPKWKKPAPEFESPSFCPADGQGGDIVLNFAKNRIDSASFYHAVDFETIRDLHEADSAAERDRDALTEDQRKIIAKYEGIAVRVTGYIKVGRKTDPKFVGAEKQGPEACNCRSNEADQVDYHITFVENPDDDFKDAIVVEMSPRLRAKHPTWNLPNLRDIARKGYPVRVFGWLLFDGEHKELMYDPTKPNKPRVRRATLWEVHPITRFEVKIGDVWRIL